MKIIHIDYLKLDIKVITNLQDNVKVVWDDKRASIGKLQKYHIMAIDSNNTIASRNVTAQENDDATALAIAKDYCKWIRKGGSQIITKHFLNENT